MQELGNIHQLIVSIGDYKETPGADPLKAGIATLVKEQEPTMVVIPDASIGPAIAVLGGHDEVAVVRRRADDQAENGFVDVTVVVGLIHHRGFDALVACLRDHVEHAGDSVGAVESSGAILEDVDALDGNLRNEVVQVVVEGSRAEVVADARTREIYLGG